MPSTTQAPGSKNGRTPYSFEDRYSGVTYAAVMPPSTMNSLPVT